ncbi:prephenate dehydratase [Sporosarcina sp. NCCP-2716]|uniref:prephenate dehydratase n=1 Tax=Sporosarcina sp. NCCP-2716 TaxID=2943679 RepID=UPI00203BBABD|nr:prephenate dehydratase [Sporosarcina sp. NCCP-2716]GKV68768.1 prephenate dehydratase [Sporosarcina sp. NCCP-2716]
MNERTGQPTVAYLGPEASFTHIAARGFFGQDGLVPYPSIPDCIEAVAEGHVAYAVVPLENALEGSVPLTIDYLFHGSELFINAELSTPIRQHLMVNEALEGGLDGLESIHSHPHALAQCHKYLQYHHRRVPLIQTSSTAAAAKYVAEHPELPIAAIGNQLAAETYGLRLADTSIHDFHFNHTRFVVLSLRKETLTMKNPGVLKTTLMVKLPKDDQPGMLHQILSVFAWRKLNLSKIESRPLKTGLGNYFFIIDVLASEDDRMMRGALEELEALQCDVTSFGSCYTYDNLLPAET